MNFNQIFKLALAMNILFWSNLPLWAEESSKLKADIPKLDALSPKEISPALNKKSVGTLKGGVEHSTKLEQKQTRLKGISGRTSLDNAFLKSRVRDNSFALESQSGFGIIGVKFVLALGKQPVINRVFPGTPAFSRGLRPNDIIVAVDGIPTMGLTKDEVYDLIIGSPGTPVTISVMRNGDFQVVTCTRMDINEITDPQVRRDYMMTM